MLTPLARRFWVSFAASLLAAYLLSADSSRPWRVPLEQQKQKNPVAATSQSVSIGAKLFREQCAVCHGLKGDGQSQWATILAKKPADLTEGARMKKLSDGEIFWKVTTGHDLMPPFAEKLTEEERWHLVNYLRTLARPKADRK